MIRLFRYLCLLLFSMLVLQAKAQLSPALLHGLLQDSAYVAAVGMNNPKLLQQFYKQTDYKIAWMNNTGMKNQEVLRRDVALAGDLGLEKDHYRLHTLAASSAGASIKSSLDSATNELLLTDAALHFYGDVRFGNRLPSFNFDGVKYQPDRTPLIALLSASLAKDDLTHFLAAVEPKDAAYIGLKKWLRYFNTLMQRSGFMEVTINAKNSDASNKALVQKLLQLQLLDSANTAHVEDSLALKIKEAQALLGLQPDGVLGPLTLRALNVPYNKELTQLKLR